MIWNIQLTLEKEKYSAEKLILYSSLPVEEGLGIRVCMCVYVFMCVCKISCTCENSKKYLRKYPRADWIISLVVWGLWHINLCRLFNAEFISIQIISSISNNSVHSLYNKYTVWLSKTFLFQAIQFSQTVLIQTIQFSISTQFICQKQFNFKQFSLA